MVVAFFGRPPLSENETGFEVLEVHRAQLFDGDRLMIQQAFLGGGYHPVRRDQAAP